MQALRLAVRRQAQRHSTISALHICRAQHDQYGPHKEYFQVPGRMPLPDTTPYAPGQPIQIDSVTHGAGPSRTRRALRSIFWAGLFGVLGVAAGTGLITWEYLQPPFERGSPEDQELENEISETFENHPLVTAAREEGWVEENYYGGRANGFEAGRHLVKDNLVGTQGITMKTFRHPSLNFTMMVCFLGFGVEGWPDVIHGGIVTTLIQEGVDRHIRNFYRQYGSPQGQIISVDFKRPTRPGEFYAVLLPPAQLEAAPSQANVTHIQVLPMVVPLEAPPKVQSQIDEKAQVENLTIDIPSTTGHTEIHALATVQVRLVQEVDEVSAGAVGRTSPVPDDKPS